MGIETYLPRKGTETIKGENNLFFIINIETYLPRKGTETQTREYHSV